MAFEGSIVQEYDMSNLSKGDFGGRDRPAGCMPVAPAGPAFHMAVPCVKTLKSWCKLGFDGWKQQDLSWTLKRSKFSQAQVYEWFSSKDALYQKQKPNETSDSESGDLSEKDGIKLN